MKDERGVTLVELLVTMTTGIIVLLGVFSVVQLVTKSSARTDARVEANQRARPVMTRIIDELHSTCLGPDAGPILAGSSGTQLGFLHRTGAAVSPIPDKRVVTLSGSTLSESVYPSTSGQAPNWVFAASPTETRQLLTDVGLGTAGDPPVVVPAFRYYSYLDGELAPTPLPTPLSATDAELTVQVTVTFSAAPSKNIARDPNPELTVSDSALVRFSPASEDPTKVNGPCV